MKVCSFSLEQNQSVVHNCDHDVEHYCDSRREAIYNVEKGMCLQPSNQWCRNEEDKPLVFKDPYNMDDHESQRGVHLCSRSASNRCQGPRPGSSVAGATRR